jgi:hypothetical protein
MPDQINPNNIRRPQINNLRGRQNPAAQQYAVAQLNAKFDDAHEKVSNDYKKIMGSGEKFDVGITTAGVLIKKDIGHGEPVMIAGASGFNSANEITLPQKQSQAPAPQTARQFKAGLDAANSSPNSNKPEDIKNAYYRSVKAALYGDIELPENVKMEHIYGQDDQQSIKDKVVLTQNEKQNFEKWLSGSGDLELPVWNKVKFAMGIADPSSLYVTGGKDDVQLNAYRNVMAQNGCPVLKLVCQVNDIEPSLSEFFQTARSLDSAEGNGPVNSLK